MSSSETSSPVRPSSLVISAHFSSLSQSSRRIFRDFLPVLCENTVWFGVAPSWDQTKNHSMPLPPPKLSLHDSSPSQDPDLIYLSCLKIRLRVNQKNSVQTFLSPPDILKRRLVSSSPVSYFMLTPRTKVRIWIWQNDTRNLGSGSATLRKKT